jgi:hypothetical protein
MSYTLKGKWIWNNPLVFQYDEAYYFDQSFVNGFTCANGETFNRIFFNSSGGFFYDDKEVLVPAEPSGRYWGAENEYQPDNAPYQFIHFNGEEEVSEKFYNIFTANAECMDTIEYKLKTIAENETKVFEAGKKAERDNFWNIFQNNGEATSYYYAFAYDNFTDDNYNPQRNIVIQETNLAGQYLYSYSVITDTKVPIYANALNIKGMFNNARGLVTINKLVVQETTVIDNAFTRCDSLKNLVIEGVIGRDFDIKSCPLTLESAISIITHLKDYKGTADENKYTISFASSVWALLDADAGNESAGLSWREYVQEIGWKA